MVISTSKKRRFKKMWAGKDGWVINKADGPVYFQQVVTLVKQGYNRKDGKPAHRSVTQHVVMY